MIQLVTVLRLCVLLLALFEITPNLAAEQGGGQEKQAADVSLEGECAVKTSKSTRTRRRQILRPEHLPPPVFFDDFQQTVQLSNLPGKPTGQSVRLGSIPQVNSKVNDENRTAPATIALLPQLVSQDSIQKIMRILRSYNASELDQDPDTVDALPTYELFVRNPELEDGNESFLKEGSLDSKAAQRRSRLRQQLSAIMDPTLDERITPFVQSHFPQHCGTEDRSCTPCYSLIRRYHSNDRPSHGMHRDGLAAVTVVVSLSTYGVDYTTGGLYVSTGYGQRQFLALSAGDAVAHTPRLLHGVHIGSANHTATTTTTNPAGDERWSWILWYRDSIHCTDHSATWFRDCARAGDVICQELQASKEEAAAVVTWNTAAAEGGSGTAAVKMARAHLGLLAGLQRPRMEEAVRYYRLAIDAYHPDGHYGMAQVYLMQKKKQKYLPRVLRHLEAAAELGHAYSMFNLGIAHTYGYFYYQGEEEDTVDVLSRNPNNWINTTLAAEWFIASGLPEGLYAAAWQAQTVLGDSRRYNQLLAHAVALGYGRPWRTEARRRTGSGGAGGVDINLPWPPAFDGRVPPLF